jgi:hypothetical protein
MSVDQLTEQAWLTMQAPDDEEEEAADDDVPAPLELDAPVCVQPPATQSPSLKAWDSIEEHPAARLIAPTRTSPPSKSNRFLRRARSICEGVVMTAGVPF